METRIYGGRMVSMGRAVAAAGMLCSVGLLTGCSSFDNRACTASRMEAHQAIVVGAGIPTAAAAGICDKAACSWATATTTDRVEVPLEITVPNPVSTITAKVSANGSPIAAPVTATPTATPSTQVQNGCEVGVEYRYTVTVTPTR